MRSSTGRRHPVEGQSRVGDVHKALWVLAGAAQEVRRSKEQGTADVAV